MENRNFIHVLILFTLLSCSVNEKEVESPLSSVIKLHSAEAILDFETAKKFIDIEKVYKTGKKNGLKAEEIWKEQLEFKHSLGKSKKFTTQFPYHKFKISEIIESKTAYVKFEEIAKNGTGIQQIIYDLNKFNDHWKIVKITYVQAN